MQFTTEHDALRDTIARFVDGEINPYVEAWEEAQQFPSHALFKKMGDLGLLGIHKPEAYGGMGLDYSYAMVAAEELGRIKCGGVPMAIGVQTDMATPALARYGSDARAQPRGLGPVEQVAQQRERVGRDVEVGHVHVPSFGASRRRRS